MKKQIKKLLCAALSLTMVAGSIVLPTVASAEYTPLVDGDTVRNEWKFDFGAADQAAETGYIAVGPGMNYTANTGDDKYGFIGTNDMDYSLDGGHIDGFVQQEGQVIELAAGGGTGINDGIGSVGKDNFNNAGDKYYPVRFALKVPDETYYKVTATVTTLDSDKPATASLYTERKHPLYTEKTIEAGQTVTTEFTVRPTPIYYKGPATSKPDGMVNVCVLGENTALASLEIQQLETATTLWVLGDSTVTDGGGELPFFPLQNYTGVGTGLTKYLPSNIAMVNEGEGGLNANDVNHFNMVSSRIKAGDYMYVEYGHNHKNASNENKMTADNRKSYHSGDYWSNDYLQALKKYYTACKTPAGNTSAGLSGTATLVVVGPIDRHNSEQYDSATNTWTSTLNGFSELGKRYVDCLLYGGEETADSFLSKWNAISAKAEQIYEVHKDTLLGVANSTDVTELQTELNTLKSEADTIYNNAVAGEKDGVENVAFVDLNKPSLDWMAGLTAETKDKASTDYYFQTTKNGSVDGTHPNDTGAENLAYYFFTTADAEKYPALLPLLANFEEGATHEVPTSVSDDIIKAGAAGKSEYWPTYQTPVAVEYPIVIKDIQLDENNHFVSLKAVTQAKYSNYAAGIVDIYSANGAKVRQIVTSEHLDNTNPLGTYTIAFDANDANAVLNDGETYKAYMWSKDMADGHIMTEEEGGEQLSSVYTATDIDTYLLPGEKTDIENFSYYGKTILTDSDKYKYGGSSSATLNLGTDSDGVTYTTVGSNGGNSFFVMRPFENLENGTGKSGKYMIDVDMQYTSGSGLNFLFAKSTTPTKSPFASDTFAAFAIGANGVVTIGGQQAGQLSASSWTNVRYILNMNTGKASLAVAGGTPVEIDIAGYQTYREPTNVIDTFKHFVLSGDKGAAFSVKLSNMTVAKLKEIDKTNISVDVNEETRGTAYIGTAGTTTARITSGDSVTVKAVANPGSVFTGWEDETGAIVSTSEELTIRAYKNTTLTANFVKELGIDEVAEFGITTDKKLVKVGSELNLSVSFAQSEDKTPIKVSNTDLEWASEDGINISADGVIKVGNINIERNTVKEITVTAKLNNLERTCKFKVYSYEYYDPVTDGETEGEFNGLTGTLADKNCIGMPAGGGTSILTLPNPVSIDGKEIEISYIAAGGGTANALCGQPRCIEFYDSKGNKVITDLIGYSWGTLNVGGTITNNKDGFNNGTNFENAVATGSWSSKVTIKLNGDGAGTVTLGGVSADITYSTSSTDIAAIKLVSSNGAPNFATRALGLTDITIADFTERPEENLTESDPTVSNGKVSMTVTSTSQKIKNVQMIVASYENGILKNLTVSDAEEIAANGNVILTSDAPTTSDFKIMLWDSVKGMYPLMMPVTELK